ncbi:hypothetical protein GCM10010381_28090 [Streptomyces xantholiticus]|nr:hypothetical protein GCM10010381_28090 [Streptomyces xantholiticus]
MSAGPAASLAFEWVAMAITVAARGHAEDPAVVAAPAGSSERKDQAAEPDALDVLEDDEVVVDEEAEDDALESDDFVAVAEEDEDAGELVDDEPRLSLR